MVEWFGETCTWRVWLFARRSRATLAQMEFVMPSRNWCGYVALAVVLDAVPFVLRLSEFWLCDGGVPRQVMRGLCDKRV